MEFGKENGKVYFVKNGIYGEDIDIEKCIVESKGSISYIENKVVKGKSPYLIKDNNNIVEKISKYIDINIDSMAYLEYDIEKDLKKNKVITVLKKIGKIREEDIEYELIKNVNIIGDDKNRYNYRNKVSLKLEVDEKKGNIIYGYYRKKTNNIVEISDCIVASEKINDVIVILNKYKKDGELIKELIKSNINEIIIRDIEEGIAIYPRIVKLEEILKKEGIKLVFKKYTNKIGDTKYIIGEKSFFQVNKYNTEKLYNKIYEFVKKIIESERKKENNKYKKIRILDIYSGVRKYRNIC